MDLTARQELVAERRGVPHDLRALPARIAGSTSGRTRASCSSAARAARSRSSISAASPPTTTCCASDTTGEGELSHADRRAHHQRDLLLPRAQPAPGADRGDPARAAARRDGAAPTPVSIWSAGCSSGEEPYSIVMLALEAGLEPGRDLRVYASDISRQMLAEGAPRRVPAERRSARREPELRRSTSAESDGCWRISDEVKRHVVFAHLNLLDAPRSRCSARST